MSRWLDTARAVLAVVEAGYAEGGTPLPARRYVSGHAPAYDCEQVTVHLARTYSYEGRVNVEVPNPIGDRSAHTLGLRAGTYAITIMRCVPVVTSMKGARPVLPQGAAIESAAEAILDDAERVPAVLAAAAQTFALNAVSLGAWISVPAQGGLAGGQVQITIGSA